MTLIDTSVWIHHFKFTDQSLIRLLENGQVMIHPFVLQELYLGAPKDKKIVFQRLEKLPLIRLVSQSELFEFIDGHKLIGSGIGLVDLHLLASAHEENIGLFTLDKKLAKVAQRILQS